MIRRRPPAPALLLLWSRRPAALPDLERGDRIASPTRSRDATPPKNQGKRANAAIRKREIMGKASGRAGLRSGTKYRVLIRLTIARRRARGESKSSGLAAGR